METTEQRRARETWQRLIGRFPVPASEWKNKSEASEYLSALKATPARIHSCGVGQALAFLKSRQSDEQARNAGKDISTLVLSMLGIGIRQGDLIDFLRRQESGASLWFLATDEAMKTIGWLCRYLEGEGVKTKQDREQHRGEAQT